ncbi:MAG: tetratricopeptide repeat protein [Aureispira sp.]
MNRLKSISFWLQIAWGICLLIGIALSFKSLREPDLWWMYRTGEWMLAKGQVTYNDPFSYMFEGVEWINVKWFFEVIIAGGKRLMGIHFVFILQAIVTLLLLTITYQSARLIRKKVHPNSTQKGAFAGWIITALLLLVTIDYRLISRPEMSSHLLTATYLYLFWRHYYQPSKAILWLLPLQLLWTNLHEAFGIGVVLMLAYLGASWVNYFYAKNKAWSRPLPKLLTGAVVGAIVAVVVNPRGPQMWAHPFNIFGQLSDNQFTTELAGITDALYWDWQAYANLIFLVGSLLLVLAVPFIKRRQETLLMSSRSNPPLPTKKSKKTAPKVAQKKALLHWWPTNVQAFGLGNGLLFFMLFYLSTTAYRNIPFFVLAAAPLFAVGLQTLIERYTWERWVNPLAIALTVVVYGSIVSGYYHDKINTRDQYGLQVLTSHNPIGAANFIAGQGIKGRCFADYLTSAYLLWRLQPEFKTYIDLRDLDIFPPEFFNNFAKVTAIPSEFDARDQSLKFDYVVLYRPQFGTLHQHLLQSERYHLVFADPVACVYLKDLPKHQAIIEQYSFEAKGGIDLFTPLPVVPSTGIAYWLSKLINPLYTPTSYEAINQDAIAGNYYLSLQQNGLAFQRAQAASQQMVAPWLGHELQGNIYSQSAFAPGTGDSLRNVYIQQADLQFSQALQLKPDYTNALIGKAVLLLQQSSLNNAIILLQQALELEPDNTLALEYLGAAYKVLATNDGNSIGSTQKWLDVRLRLNNLLPNNPATLLDIGIAYCLLSDCTQSMAYLNRVMELPNLPANEFALAQRCVKNCSQL